MSRKVDTPGHASEPSPPLQPGEEAAPLLIEIPLWKFGRVKFESRSQKASLALVALVVLVFIIAILSGMEAMPGEHPGVSTLISSLGQALMLVLGVLLGVDWKGSGPNPKD
ncbi:hypothetical protein MKK58_09425 [Methylobacterium sp. J-078]|uniref:hypothetical protein n=1 Tax=Methylobacterium sp. J-078 TaxID=2836657 RepID=UPI001FB99F78|nr:hypothetical protein [Methylobacterium sp. J-078]MCJ2044746.1 hypothetical protein [Methylobacterium sp. J-078]